MGGILLGPFGGIAIVIVAFLVGMFTVGGALVDLLFQGEILAWLQGIWNSVIPGD